jgi:hypothetical protein
MTRRELLTSKKARWNRHFLHQKCHMPVSCDTLDSSFVRAGRNVPTGNNSYHVPNWNMIIA